MFLILNEEKENSLVNFLRLKKAYNYLKTELVTADGDLFLTFDSLIRINNIITGSNNILLRQINVKPAFYEKEYMHFEKIDQELYILIDKFNERNITKRDFLKKFLDEIHPFADGNGRTCKICLLN